MFDAHYDLLSIELLTRTYNKNDYLLKVLERFKDKSGVIANLYFMSKEEMKNEFMLTDINVLELFILTKKNISALVSTDIIYSIEGADYIKDIEELELLYKEGLDSLLLVWNNPNKYASGIRGDYGLTKEGEKLVRKAIDLGIALDLSHANEKTFFDLINLIKEEQQKGKDVICYASHSNSYELKNHKRNLTKEQLLALREVSGMIGVVLYPPFIGEKKDIFKHLSYMIEIFGLDKVMIATDDMSFTSIYNKEYKSFYEINNIKEELEKDLKKHFSSKDVQKLLYSNGKRLYNEIKERRKC